MLTVEESYILIKDHNKGKNILSECILGIDKDHIRLITKDEGDKFNINEKEEHLDSFRKYFLYSIKATNNMDISLLTQSMNVNIYVFNL